MELPRRQEDGDETKEKMKKKMVLMQEAIQELMEKRKHQREDNSLQKQREEEEELLFCKLLSKLDSLEKDADLNKEGPSSAQSDSEITDGENTKEVELGEIAKDLTRIKRQNLITHCLLGAVIVMTAVWQFNEVSFLLAVRKKLSNPLKSVGELIKGSLKGRGKKPVIEEPPLPPVAIPDLHRSDLPLLVLNEDD